MLIVHFTPIFSDMTEQEIDKLEAGEELDELLQSCGLYDGDGNPSRDKDLAQKILDSQVSLFSDSRGMESFFTREFGMENDQHVGRIANNDYSIEARGETYALMLSRLLAKYCLIMGKLKSA